MSDLKPATTSRDVKLKPQSSDYESYGLLSKIMSLSGSQTEDAALRVELYV